MRATAQSHSRAATNLGNTLGRSTSNESFVATPVPEPQIYALMLAGLGVPGFLARRRKAVPD